MFKPFSATILSLLILATECRSEEISEKLQYTRQMSRLKSELSRLKRDFLREENLLKKLEYKEIETAQTLANHEKQILLINIDEFAISDRKNAALASYRKIENKRLSLEKRLDNLKEHVTKRIKYLYLKSKLKAPGIVLQLLRSHAPARDLLFFRKIFASDQASLGDLLQTERKIDSNLTDQRKIINTVRAVQDEHLAAKDAISSEFKLLASKRETFQKLKQDQYNSLKKLRSELHRLSLLLNQNFFTQSAKKNSELKQSDISLKKPFPRPVPGLVISKFGIKQLGEANVGVLYSKGIEIEVMQESSVSAVSEGSVVLATELPGYGKTVIINHGGRNYTLYSRLSKMEVAEGDSVAIGQKLGIIASSGSERLYFEVRINGNPVNPELYFMY